MRNKKTSENIAALQKMNTSALRAKYDLEFINASIGPAKMGGVLPGTGFRTELITSIQSAGNIAMLIADELRDIRAGMKEFAK